MSTVVESPIIEPAINIHLHGLVVLALSYFCNPLLRYISTEATIGVLAIQLGLLDDAAQLFRESGRYDLLNRLYQSAGLWDKAISTATAKVLLHFQLCS
jgi:hypothetical protein